MRLFFLLALFPLTIWASVSRPSRVDTTAAWELPVQVLVREYGVYEERTLFYDGPREIVTTHSAEGRLTFHLSDSTTTRCILQFFAKVEGKKELLHKEIELPTAKIKSLAARLADKRRLVTLDLAGNSLYALGVQDEFPKVIIQPNGSVQIELSVTYHGLTTDKTGTKAVLAEDAVSVDYRDVADHILPPFDLTVESNNFSDQRFFIPFKGEKLLPILVIDIQVGNRAEAVVIPLQSLRKGAKKTLYRVPVSVLRLAGSKDSYFDELQKTLGGINAETVEKWLKPYELPTKQQSSFLTHLPNFPELPLLNLCPTILARRL